MRLGEMWEAGDIDASWFCVDFWLKEFRSRVVNVTVDQARVHLGLPPARIPADLPDDRFNYEKRGRYCRCDVCHKYCPARARDYQPGSFVYAADNSLAGPDSDRSSCFPSSKLRSEAWTLGRWNATYACRACLPRFWKHPAEIIDEWLAFHHRGARDHVRITQSAAQRPQGGSWSSSSWRSSWQGWSSAQPENRW